MATQDTGIDSYISLGSDINKQKSANLEETKQGIISTKLPELTLEMKDEEIVKLTDKWKKDWDDSPKKQEWEKQIEENEKYWLGKQFEGPKLDSTRPMVDNLIFESLETYLPQATRRNPEPLVMLDSSERDEQGNEDPVKTRYVEKVKAKLADLADKNKMRLKLKKSARHWSIYQLAVAKMGWDLNKQMPVPRIIRPKRMILDPNATIDEDGYTGDYIGEYRKLSASKILAVMGDTKEEMDETGKVTKAGNGKAIKAVKDLVKDELETKIQFIEWWTPEYFCWKLGSDILLKKKNPNWNYDQDVTNENVDDYGNVVPTTETIQGINHLPIPQMPYVFLSVFNLGDQPMDKTSLIQQNLSNQDKINKRDRQIDKNADKMNGGAVVSLERAGLTQPQANNVVTAIRKGGAVIIPSGNPQEAVYFPQVPNLPSDVFNDRNDTRERLRDIFGTRGSSAAGLETEQTVRGKIMNRGLDTDRIGGGVTEFLEQYSDDIYNWLVQLLYVYDPAYQFVGGARPPKVIISVKEGSLMPKDSTSIATQALDLAAKNRISNLDLYKRLEWPNPEEVAANVWLEINAPQLLYRNNPLIMEAMAMQAQAAQAQKDAESVANSEKHTQEMERESSRADANIRGEFVKSALKEVPIPKA